MKKLTTNPPAVSARAHRCICAAKAANPSVHACQIGFLVFFFAQWEISARLGWIDSFILSQPSRILETLRNMSQNHLMMHVGVTLYETLTGFVLGVLLGVAIAVVLWWSGFVSRVAEPYLVCQRLPKTRWACYHHVVGAGTEAIIYGRWPFLIVTVQEMLRASVQPTRNALKWRDFGATNARFHQDHFRPISTHCLIH
jgi:NitT/TauT family transport system permease protein